MRMLHHPNVLLTLGLLLLGTAGCASTPPTLNAHGAVFYCGGAGGGPGLRNWGLGVQKGLQEAGYTGTFDEFPWKTGLGMFVDQTESVKAKRAQAAKLAKQITAYQARYPGSPVNLMGLSAGTAVAVFALESLPTSSQVDTVVLLSSSLSGDYDLTAALRHVRGDVYVTTSPNDTMLGDMVPVFGTADREYVGQKIAGLHGFSLPPQAGPLTRRLYAKVILLAWDPKMELFGDYGHHLQTADPSFVQHVIAPLLTGEGPRQVRVHPQGTSGTYQTPVERK
jgi:hypothetical protein